jgi:predicted SAM-dependent methyltransferase
MTRNERLLGPVDRSMRIIEIGPSFSPIAAKADGWNVCSIDHLPRAELVAKYTGHAGVDVSRIEEVDFVWTDGPLSSAAPPALRGTFQALIASHVIEHSPDLLAFLDSAAELLTRDGVVALAVPDKRYCFDYFKPLSLTGDVLAAHDPSRSRHTIENAFNEVAYAAAVNGSIAWTQAPIEELDLLHSLAQARDFFNALASANDGQYHDMHAWRFTPSSFALIMLELAWLGKTDWYVEDVTAANGCEFLTWLRRGGLARARSLSDSELAAKRLLLLKQTVIEMKEQVDFFVGAPAAAAPPSAPAATPILLPPGDNRDLQSGETALSTRTVLRKAARFLEHCAAAPEGQVWHAGYRVIRSKLSRSA